MTTRRKTLIQRFLKCPNCGKVITLWAKGGRKKGHVKTMNCYYCGKLVDMVELDKYGIDNEENKT